MPRRTWEDVKIGLDENFGCLAAVALLIMVGAVGMFVAALMAEFPLLVTGALLGGLGYGFYYFMIKHKDRDWTGTGHGNPKDTWYVEKDDDQWHL
jgi:hypothetical protein